MWIFESKPHNSSKYIAVVWAEWNMCTRRSKFRWLVEHLKAAASLFCSGTSLAAASQMRSYPSSCFVGRGKDANVSDDNRVWQNPLLLSFMALFFGTWTGFVSSAVLCRRFMMKRKVWAAVYCWDLVNALSHEFKRQNQVDDANVGANGCMQIGLSNEAFWAKRAKDGIRHRFAMHSPKNKDPQRDTPLFYKCYNTVTHHF